MTIKKNKDRPLFAKNFSYLRNRLRLTKRDMLEATGIPISTWGSYEEGRAFPKHHNLPAICETLQFYDVLAIVSKDLANDKELVNVNSSDAIQAIRKLETYLKQMSDEEMRHVADSH